MTLKVLEENLGDYVSNLGGSQIFLRKDTKALPKKRKKIGKVDRANFKASSLPKIPWRQAIE